MATPMASVELEVVEPPPPPVVADDDDDPPALYGSVPTVGDGDAVGSAPAVMSQDNWKLPSALPTPSTRMYTVVLVGGLRYEIMGAAATPWLVSHPVSVTACTTSELDNRGVRQLLSSHRTELKVVAVEQVLMRSRSTPAGMYSEKYASPDACPKYDGVPALDPVTLPLRMTSGVTARGVPQLTST